MTYFFEDLNNHCTMVSAHEQCALKMADDGYDVGTENLGTSGMKCDICGCGCHGEGDTDYNLTFM